MIGLVAVLLFVAVYGWLGGRAASARFGLDPAESVGVGGLLAVGSVGWFTFVLFWAGLGQASFPIASIIVGLVSFWLGRNADRIVIRWSLMPGVAFVPFAAIAIVNALAPPDTLEWDSLAYHLAVPKIWAQAGHPIYLPTQHHSNFPFALDILAMPLLGIGESAAKGLSVGLLALGLLAIFGFTRRNHGDRAAWWASLALAASPVVLWETGTAYIDVSHGLYAGLALLYVGTLRAERPPWLLIASLLGLACSTKYTGLQATVAVGVVGAIWCVATRRFVLVPKVALVCVAAVAISSPWLARNIANTGNPVYPFLYERLGGRGWDQWRADIYRNEQQTFGVGRTDTGRRWSDFPHSVLGLAYQPGRFINPNQSDGGGFPMGATGALLPVGAVLWLLLGKRESSLAVSLAVGVTMLVLWFSLSQQSRYLVPMLVPMAVACAALIQTPRIRIIFGTLLTSQCAYTLALLVIANTQRQLPVVLGQESRQNFYDVNCTFANFAPKVDEIVGSGNVALYDEVFGYFLNVRYVWANPGHSTLFDATGTESPPQFVDQFHRAGVTHILVNLRYMSREDRAVWLQPANLEPRRSELMANPDRRWLVLLNDAVSENRLQVVAQEGSYCLLKILDEPKLR